MKNKGIKKIFVSGIFLLCLLGTCSMSVGENLKNNAIVQPNRSSLVLAADILDIIVSNAHSNSISFYPGKGNDEFGLRRDVSAGQAPSGMVAGDFNKDGNLDLAIADMNSSDICILLGDGLGRFSAPNFYTVGEFPSDVITEDFNQDSNLDLAVANQNDSTVSILYGKGNGTFGGLHDYPVGTGPANLVSADFDGDGYLDIAVTNSDEATVGVLLGNGISGFQSCLFYPCGIDYTSKPLGLVLGDFNNDTILDLAVAVHNTNSIVLLPGDGVGGFLNPAYFELGTGTGPNGITAGDFNEDKNLDIAITDQQANSISVLFGNGAGNFGGRRDFPVMISPAGIIAAHFSADDDLDLAVANHDSSSITILSGDGTGLFRNPLNLTVGAGPTALVAGKFRYDTTNPQIQITKPTNGIYLMNKKILPFFKPLIFGKIDIQVNASDNSSGIDRVEFYIDSKLMNTSTTEPYFWTWSKVTFFKHTITAIAFDNADNSAQATIIASKFL